MVHIDGRSTARRRFATQPEIEGMRGIAVLSVFAVHSVPDSLHGGFIGVDVFFVISGYLIASITLRELDDDCFSILEFYARRIRRLLPALLIVLLACLAFAYRWALPSDAKAIGTHVIAGLAFASNIALWREAGYFDAASLTKPLLHLWSLGIEAQFYLLWPLAAVLLLRGRRRAVWWVGAALLASFTMNVAMVGSKPKGTFFLPPTRFWELLVGALLACWCHRSPGGPLEMCRRALLPNSVWQLRLPNVFANVGIALLATALWLIDKTNRFPGWWALLPTLATVLILAAGTEAWVNRTVLVHPVLTFYGRISYPLYLWHWPLLTAPLLLDFQLDLEQQVAMLAACVALAASTYYLIEAPLRFGRPASNAPHLIALGMVVVGGLGWHLVRSEGLLDRYPAAVRAIAEVDANGDYANYRVERCFLRSEQTPAAFAADCVDGVPSQRPLLLLWGDSHAAAMYAGLQTAARDPVINMRLAQFTAAACPPGLRAAVVDNPHCADVNDHVAQQIGVLRPTTVALAAHWSHLFGEQAGPTPEESLELLRRTVAELRALGVKDIVVFGPLPRWPIAPSRLLLRAWSQSGASLAELPERSSSPLDASTLELDRTMRLTATVLGVRYVSPIEGLCNALGCATFARDGEKYHAIAFDATHLTAAGSRLLVGVLRPFNAVPHEDGTK